jgi:hypothetical protein
MSRKNNLNAITFRLSFKPLQQIPIKPAAKELPQRLKADATMMKPIKSIFISNSINRHSDRPNFAQALHFLDFIVRAISLQKNLV